MRDERVIATPYGPELHSIPKLLGGGHPDTFVHYHRITRSMEL